MSGPRSRLEALLKAGHFVVTSELSAVDSADPQAVAGAARHLAGAVDAVNCTDNSAAHVHISPVAAGHLLVDAGMDPIVQFTCRDRNRLALQADIVGAAALGIRNIECMTGDDVTAGDHPEARSLYDLDALHLLRTATELRDRGTYLSGRSLEAPPRFFLGAVENPFAPPHDFRPHRTLKKVEAGAEFFQLQLAFNLRRLGEFMARITDLGIQERAAVIPSVYVARSARSLRYLRDQVPGIDVPDDVLARVERVPEDRQAAEGIRLATELVAAVRELPGAAGVHVIAIKWEEAVSQVVEAAGLLPRPADVVLEPAS